MNHGGGRAAGDTLLTREALEREPGYYWVRLRDRKRSHLLFMGKFYREAWVGVTPWRIDGQWYAERDLRVCSARLLPPEEEEPR